MYRVIFAIVILVVGTDCRSFTISGPTWKNEVKACVSGGEHHHSYTFYLGRLSEYNITYEDISVVKTLVDAEGDLQLKTGKEGWVPKTSLQLLQRSESPQEYKQFRGSWRMDSYRGWASQSVEMVITVKFYDDDNIHMDTNVSAGSWMSVTCSETRAYVERIKVKV